MTRSHASRRKRRSPDVLLEKGVTVSLLGMVFLVGPVFVGNSLLASLAGALRTPGWIALGVGAVLIGLHFLQKRKAHQPDEERKSHRSQMPAALAEAVNDVFATGAPGESLRQASKGPARTSRSLAQPARNTTVTAPNFLRGAQRQTAWSPAVFAAIEWRRFEAVCELLFSQAGFTARTQSHGADGGVDIWLYSAHAQGPATIAQCKHWTTRQVGVKEMREFFGVMTSHQLKRGTYATTSTYTPDAMAFAKANKINALDGAGILRLIASRTPEQQQALLSVAYEGEFWRPTCASCGVKLVERTPGKGGPKFWGCGNFPRCKTRMTMALAPVC